MLCWCEFSGNVNMGSCFHLVQKNTLVMFTATIIHKQLMCPNVYMLHFFLFIHNFLPVHTHIYMYGNAAANWLTCSKNSLTHIPSHTPTQRGEFWTQHHYPVRRYNTCKKAQKRWAKAGKWRNNQEVSEAYQGHHIICFVCLYLLRIIGQDLHTRQHLG